MGEEELIKELKHKIKVNERSRRKMQQSLMKEIERLNNIINELEKWVKEDKECFETQFYMGRCVNFQCILDKLQELKGE